MSSKLNTIIFSSLTFITGLICLLCFSNPVPISIAPGFIVGETGSKWIMLLFLFLGLIIPSINFAFKQRTPEQKVYAKRQQIYLNVIFTIWILITYFFVCLFNNQKIIGSKVLISVTSLSFIFVACGLSLFSELFEKLAKKDNFNYNLRLYTSVTTAQIAGYVLFVTAVVNIFVDSLFLMLPVAVVCALAIYLVPLFIVNKVKAEQKSLEEDAVEQEKAAMEKLASAVSYATASVETKAPKKTTKSKTSKTTKTTTTKKATTKTKSSKVTASKAKKPVTKKVAKK